MFKFSWLYVLVTMITVANLVIWLIEKIFYRFSVTNNAVLPEFNLEKVDLLKSINKHPFIDLKIWKAVKSR